MDTGIMIFCMFFELTNAPTTFMDFMNGIFKTYLYSFVIVFIYDIFIYSKSTKNNVNHFYIIMCILGNKKYIPSSPTFSFEWICWSKIDAYILGLT